MHARAGGRCPRGVAGRSRGGVQGARGSARRWCAHCCCRRRRRRPCGSRAIHAGAARHSAALHGVGRDELVGLRRDRLAWRDARCTSHGAAVRYAMRCGVRCAGENRLALDRRAADEARVHMLETQRAVEARPAPRRCGTAAPPPSPPMRSRSWGSQFQRSGARCCCGAGGAGGPQAQCGRRALAAREGVGAARGAAGECIGPPPPQGARACCARKRQGLRVQAVAVPT